MQRKLFFGLMFFIVAAFFVSAPLSAADSTSAPVHVIHAPDNSLVPDVILDAKGVLHMVYGLGDHAWYVRSTDNGRTFTRPVAVNSEGQVSLKMGERGPKLAVGSNGSIHVVWMDCWSPGVKVFVRHARSTDGGKSFGPIHRVSTMPGVDGTTVAADGKGNVVVFWHVAHPPQDAIPQATPLHMARSTDDGATFQPDEHLKIKNLGELACSMCMTRARSGPDGCVYLAFRTAEKNIRDFYVLKAPIAENDFTALRVNEDNWELKTCPMCGPELVFDPAGRAVCAFMSRHKVYWAVSDDARTAFRLHVPTPGQENDEIYPTAVANRKGMVLMVWQVGPMAVGRQATVKWALYHADGRPTGDQGTLGISTSGTKPTAFVGTDDQFHIVTTAKPRP